MDYILRMYIGYPFTQLFYYLPDNHTIELFILNYLGK